MARTVVTCTQHYACQVETGDRGTIHHQGDPQPRSPLSPEGTTILSPERVKERQAARRRWWARQKRKWKRRLFV